MSKPDKFIGIYLRVSSAKQDHRSQLPDLERWATAQDAPVKWYRDKFTGKTMERPGWRKLEADIRAGKVGRLVCWRLDRLGRTTKGLCQLFDDLLERKVDLVSLRDGFTLDTPAGRHFARMLASQAEYERELIAERVIAGQAVARQNGKRWGGSKPGVRKRVTPAQERMILEAKGRGEQITAIAAATGLSRPTIYSVLRTPIPS